MCMKFKRGKKDLICSLHESLALHDESPRVQNNGSPCKRDLQKAKKISRLFYMKLFISMMNFLVSIAYWEKEIKIMDGSHEQVVTESFTLESSPF